MRRLLFVVNVDWFFASHRLPIAAALIDRGVEIHLACGTTPGWPQRLQAAGLQVHELPFTRRGRSPVELAGLVPRLRALQRRLRPDVVHNVSVKPVLLGSIAARLAGTPAVVNAISGFGHLLAPGESGRLARTATLTAYRLALRAPRTTRVIFQNRAALEGFVARRLVRPDDAVLIRGMGVDPDRFHPPEQEPDPPVVMLTARMIRSKGVEEFLQAAAQLRDRFPDVRFELVGGPDDGNPLAYRANELARRATDHGVHYLGASDDVAAAMQHSTIQVLPTHHEGLPKSLLEAAATGRAIVTTDIPGCREVIDDHHNGRLVPVGDVDRLTDVLAELLTDPAQRDRLGAAARQRVEERFTVDRIVEQHLALYEEVTA